MRTFFMSYNSFNPQTQANVFQTFTQIILSIELLSIFFYRQSGFDFSLSFLFACAYIRYARDCVVFIMDVFQNSLPILEIYNSRYVYYIFPVCYWQWISEYGLYIYHCCAQFHQLINVLIFLIIRYFIT